MFRILSSVDALNEKMGLNLTHHDANGVYNLHHLQGQGYYLKTRYPELDSFHAFLTPTNACPKIS